MNKTQLLWSLWLIFTSCVVPARGELVTISAVDIFSYDLQGSIPPNVTRVIDVGGLLGASGTPYNVVGLGWDLTIDVFAPSWLSDASISFGDDPSFQSPQFVLVPGLGLDFPALQFFSSGGVRDLTNWDGTGQDYSFEISTGQLYLEFFESYDDYIGLPDAWYIAPSTLTLEVVPVPEPGMVVLMPLAGVALCRRRRRS